MLPILFCALSLNGHAELTDSVDLVEVNHFYNSSGELVFDQVIWLEWNTDKGRYDVVDWRLLRNVRLGNSDDKWTWDTEHPEGPPYVESFIGGHATPTRVSDRWESYWLDEKCGKWRTVRAKHYRETWTDWDVELVARTVLPEEQRTGLTRITPLDK